MNKENVLAVADAIEGHTIPDIGFNMLDFVMPPDRYGALSADRMGTGCDTVACIAGWTKRIRTGLPIAVANGSSFDWQKEADWLGLTTAAASELFYGDEGTNGRLSDVTPTEAVAVLRHLAETGKVDWSIAKPESQP